MKRIYQTKQRKQLIEFLSVHREYSIEQIVEEMASDESPAKSSIYRLMKQLVEEGLVKRYTKEDSRQFVYELVNGENCNSHFHLKCLKCGKLIHLSEKVSKNTKRQVLSEAGFAIDQEKTIMFGRCEVCQKDE